MNQSQHTLQQLLLRQFQHRGKIIAVDRDSLGVQDPNPSPKQSGCLIDFQSEDNEHLDNHSIETPASKLLKGFKTRTGVRSTAETPESDHWCNLQLAKEERVILDNWIALHLTRSPRDIDDLKTRGISYDRARAPSLNDSLKMAKLFRNVWKYVRPGDTEPLILSDHPIIPFARPGLTIPECLYFPFGHKMLIVLSNSDPSHNTFSGRTWSQAANEMSFCNSHRRFYCDPRFIPVLRKLERRAIRTMKSEMKSQLRIPAG